MFQKMHAGFSLKCIGKNARKAKPCWRAFAKWAEIKHRAGCEISSLDTRAAFGYVSHKLRQGSLRCAVPSLGIRFKVLLALGLFLAALPSVPLLAQQPASKTTKQDSLYALAEAGSNLESIPAYLDLRSATINWMPENATSYTAPRVHLESSPFDRTAWNSTPRTIQRMESAFSCNDTPFVDQVRLPLATFWRGRVKLTGFESDVTTANFVLGLPGQGALHSLSAFGNAFIATHTPPSDQLAGIHMTFSWRPAGTESSENSGRRGIEYLVRASRSALPFLGPRSEAAAASR